MLDKGKMEDSQRNFCARLRLANVCVILISSFLYQRKYYSLISTYLRQRVGYWASNITLYAYAPFKLSLPQSNTVSRYLYSSPKLNKNLLSTRRIQSVPTTFSVSLIHLTERRVNTWTPLSSSAIGLSTIASALPPQLLCKLCR